MSLKDRLEKLEDNQREQLIYAFNHDLSQIIHLENGRIIGVNVFNKQNINVLESAGDWIYGEEE